MGLTEAIAEAFSKCSVGCVSSSGAPVINDFTAVVKVLWPILDNNVSLCDLSGVFTISSPSRSDGALDLKLFTEFLTALAKIKYPTVGSPVELLLKEITNAKSVHFGSDNALFAKLIDKHVIRVLLKFDLPLRRAFSAFAGDESMARVGGSLNWEDVKNRNIGMEVQGFTNFASSYSLIPDLLSPQQCTLLTKDVVQRFPVLATADKPNVLLYPQFQLLLALSAATIATSKSAGRAGGTSDGKVRMAPSAAVQDPKRLAESLSDLLKNIGVSFLPNSGADWGAEDSKRPSGLNSKRGSRPESPSDDGPAHAWSAVCMPTSDHPQDLYSALERPGGETAQLRIQHLFADIAQQLKADRSNGEYYASNSFSRTFTAMALNSQSAVEMRNSVNEVPEEVDPEDVFHRLGSVEWESDPSAPLADDQSLFDTRAQLVVKPTVIGDAVPPPLDCPLSVLHLLEAALAHHNLGSYDEALKFLGAARSTLIENVRMELEEKRRKMSRASQKTVAAQSAAREGGKGDDATSTGNVALDPTLGLTIPPTPQVSGLLDGYGSVDQGHQDKVTIPFDIDMYITVCMGNIYQSSGDDEQALIQYQRGWANSKDMDELDWATIFLNSIALVAYYNLRYELGYQCFVSVADYRAKEYGIRSVDTASAWNNQGCCQFGLARYTEARLAFERALNVLETVLGPRHPRSVVILNNVDKAKKSLGIKMHIKDMKESISIRPDSDRLLIGSKYIIRALPPPEKKKKGIKAKKGGGKKKKK